MRKYSSHSKELQYVLTVAVLTGSVSIVIVFTCKGWDK